MQQPTTSIHPIAFFSTLLTNAVTFAISCATHIESILRVTLLIVSIALTVKQFFRKPKTPKAPSNRQYLSLAGGFLLLCFMLSACATADHLLLNPSGGVNPAITNGIAHLQSINTATAPFDPYAPLIQSALAAVLTGVGWYAHARAKGQQLDAQTQHIATLQSRVFKSPTVTQSKLP